MITRIDLEEIVKKNLSSDEKFIWCGSTVPDAKISEREEDGFYTNFFSWVIIAAAVLSAGAMVLWEDMPFNGKLMFCIFAAACIAGVFLVRKRKMRDENYALTDKRALLVSDSGRILKEYDFRDWLLRIDHRGSKRNIGYVLLFTRGYRGSCNVHFRFRGVSDPDELFDLVNMVLEYHRQGGKKIIQTGAPADGSAPVRAAQPTSEAPAKISGYKKLSDVTGVSHSISDAENEIKPLSIQHDIEYSVREYLESGERLLWCEGQDTKSVNKTKGGCVLTCVCVVGVCELVLQLFAKGLNYPKEIMDMTRMFFIPAYVVMFLLLIAALVGKSKDTWAVTDRRILVIGKKHIRQTLLSEVPMNGIQLTCRPDRLEGDMRIRGSWRDYRTGKLLEQIQVWVGVSDPAAVGDLIERAAVRYLKMQGFEEVGIESEQLYKDAQKYTNKY